MAYSSEIESLKKIIAELEQLGQMMYQVESRVAALEKIVCSIDESLPDDEEISAMKPGRQKDSLNKVIDLANEAYNLVDELIGPPNQTDDLSFDHDAIMPQARGNDANSLEAALRKFYPNKSGGKNTAS